MAQYVQLPGRVTTVHARSVDDVLDSGVDNLVFVFRIDNELGFDFEGADKRH